MSRKNRRAAVAATPVVADEVATEEIKETQLAAEEETVQDIAEVDEAVEQEVEETIEEVEEEVISEEAVEKEEETVVDQKAEVKPQVVKEETKVNPIRKDVLIVTKAKAPVAAAPAVQNPNVIRFNEIADAYVKVMTGPQGEDTKKKGINALVNMANFVLMSKDPAVFEACFQFMLKNRSIMLVPQTVISGINTAIAKDKIAKIVQFYVTFQSLVESKMLKTRFTLNVTTIKRVLGNEAFANWLLVKRG